MFMQNISFFITRIKHRLGFLDSWIGTLSFGDTLPEEFGDTSGSLTTMLSLYTGHLRPENVFDMRCKNSCPDTQLFVTSFFFLERLILLHFFMTIVISSCVLTFKEGKTRLESEKMEKLMLELDSLLRSLNDLVPFRQCVFFDQICEIDVLKFNAVKHYCIRYFLTLPIWMLNFSSSTGSNAICLRLEALRRYFLECFEGKNDHSIV